MKKRLHIATGPLTNEIYVGHILKDGCTWGANRQSVTPEALFAVAYHALNFGEPIEIGTEEDGPMFRITVEDLRK